MAAETLPTRYAAALPAPRAAVERCDAGLRVLVPEL